MEDLLKKLEAINYRFIEVGTLIVDPDIISDMDRYVKLSKEYRDLEEVVIAYKEYKNIFDNIRSSKELLEIEEDQEMREMAKMEINDLEQKRPELEERIKMLLIPKDPEDDKNAIMELRAGTGGDEACIFVEDIFRMYTMFFKEIGWKYEIINSSEGTTKGYKEISMNIEGEGLYGMLKFESGVHRVQRVPETESQGRVHTSAITVAVLPEAEEVDFHLDMNDVRKDTFRASGAGGQHINKTESAIRLTHIPTGIVVSCQNERSQLQNKATAMAVLQARILERTRQEEQAKINALKGDTSGSWGNQMRSYVLHPYQMVKDIRTEVETGNTSAVLDGDIDQFVEAGIRWRREQSN